MEFSESKNDEQVPDEDYGRGSTVVIDGEEYELNEETIEAIGVWGVIKTMGKRS